MKTYTEEGYRDVDEAYLENKDTNPHHFHHYDSGLVTYKKEYIHLYKEPEERFFECSNKIMVTPDLPGQGCLNWGKQRK